MGGDAPMVTPLLPAVWRGAALAGALTVTLNHEVMLRMAWQSRKIYKPGSLQRDSSTPTCDCTSGPHLYKRGINFSFVWVFLLYVAERSNTKSICLAHICISCTLHSVWPKRGAHEKYLMNHKQMGMY